MIENSKIEKHMSKETNKLGALPFNFNVYTLA